MFAKDSISVGGFGVFLLLAYAAGHVLAGFGNAIELLLWYRRGMRSNRVTRVNPKPLTRAQIDLLVARVRSRLGLELREITGMAHQDWHPTFGRIYCDVLKNDPGRKEGGFV